MEVEPFRVDFGVESPKEQDSIQSGECIFARRSTRSRSRNVFRAAKQAGYPRSRANNSERFPAPAFLSTLPTCVFTVLSSI